MFGASKPPFGGTQPSGFGFNNPSTASPFGQSTFGKPAAPGFGQTSTFGQQNTSLFGGGQPTGGLFGSTTTSAFGAQQPTTQPGFGGFSQPQSTSVFGSGQQNQNASIFGQTGGSAFGAAKPGGFGFSGTQPNNSIFGQASTSTTANANFFGQQTQATGGIFGSASAAGFGGGPTGSNGTTIAKYQPSVGTDTLVKNGQTNSVTTKQHCITAMKEYEGKSLEELRMEDYMANRKGPQAGAPVGLFGSQAQSAGIFGAAPAQQTSGLFGQTQENKPLFGVGNTMSGFGAPTNTFATATSQPSAGGIFNKPFAAPTTSASTFGFPGTTNTATNPFGQKPFNMTTPGGGLFNTGGGTTTGTTQFGQPNTGFLGFGQTTTNQNPPLFGGGTGDKPAFGVPAATSSGFGFGTNTNTMTGGSSIFQPKPATGFTGGTGFGATSTAAPAFGFGQANTGGSLFNSSFNKPTGSTFGGFGTQTATAPLGGLGTGTGGSIFGNNNKPGSLFGNTMAQPTGGSLFNNTGFSSFGNSSNTLGGLGQTTSGLTTGFTQQQQTTTPIHQQILALATSPYGENPIFKDLKPPGGPTEESLKPTNPAAQKAILESNSNQFKVSPRVANGIRVKPVGSVLTKKSLFEGLEEYDSTVEESFSLKPNARRLIIKPKPSSSTNTLNSSNNQSRLSLLNVSETQKSPYVTNTSGGNDLNLSASNKENQESFNNEIPTTMPTNAANDNSRRVSWLQSNALEKVRQTSRNTDSVLDNTIQELVTGKDRNDVEKLSTSLVTSTEKGVSHSSIGETSSSSLKSTSNVSAKISVDNSLTPNVSYMDETAPEILTDQGEPHPTGITLRRLGYYTIPSLDELCSYLNEDGTCIVPNFTIGREGYGNVYFDEVMDVAGLNLDEIVHFRHKEIVIYPDDETKPPIGVGLNRKAQITLDQVWPHDKTVHEPIKDVERLTTIDYEGKLRRVCDKHDTRFIEYRPETGSWVFKVDHFSKYGLSDSDEEEPIKPVDPKKAKMTIQNIPPTSLTAQKALLLSKEKTEQLNQLKSSNLLQEVDIPATMDLRYLTTLEQGYEDEEYNMDFINYHKATAVSPTASLAKEMGTDSHKLQLMKASFFADDEPDRQVFSELIVDDRESPDQIVPFHSRFSSLQSLYKGSSMNSLRTMTDDTPITSIPSKEMEIKKREVEREIRPIIREIVMPKSLPLIIKPKVALMRIPGTVVPFHNSVSYKLQGKCLADAALMFGKSFRISWGPRNMMTVLNTAENSQSLKKEVQLDELTIFLKGRPENDYSSTVLQLFEISSSSKINSFHNTIENYMKIQLRFCAKNKIENSDCPHFTAAGGTDLLSSNYELSKSLQYLSDYEKYAVTVWSLCDALWGEEEELEGQDPSSHLTVMCRRDLFSNWLEGVVTEKNLQRDTVSKAEYLNHLMDLLCAHKVADACEFVFKNDDINLSLLLSQLSGGPTVRQTIQHQLSSWQEVEADKYIDSERIKAYMLVAGIPIMSSSHGTINVFENISWLKAVALHLWYLCSPTSSITDALMNYEQDFMADEPFAMPPLPPYTNEYIAQSSKPIQDIRYHILKLYSKRSHPMEKLLNPATHTADPMDFRLSWLLMQTLQTLGYHHCSELSESQLHVSFASQLENYGLWHWSIFVLLHIRNQAKRELCVQQILYRYITLSLDPDYVAKESFIIEKLEVPMNWIYWAKAVRAGSLKKYHEQAKYLLSAKQWSLAHEVIMQYIAPDAIINDNIDYLKSLLELFDDPRQISNWQNQGQILIDYIDINEKFETLKQISEGDLEARWEGLKPQLAELCSRINLFPCPTAKHRLCQSEIAQRLACLVRGVILTSPYMNPCLLIKVALEKLPLPQEYAQQELRVLLDNVLVNVFRATSENAMDEN